MQRVAFSPIAIVGVCVRPCVFVCMPRRRWLNQVKSRLEINPPLFHQLEGHTKPCKDLFGNVVTYDFDILSKGQRFELRQFLWIKRDYLASGDRMSKYY